MSLLTETNLNDIADSIYTGMIEHFDIHNECVNVLIDGSTENTVYGQNVLFEIQNALTRALESLEGEQNA